MNDKQVRARYTQEFKLEAVRPIHGSQSQSEVAQVLGISEASLGNWVRLATKGQLAGDAADSKADKAAAISPEQMEITRLRAQVAWLRMERDITKKRRRTSRRIRCEVRLD